MNISEKVPSLELCQKMFELGITNGVKFERVWFDGYVIRYDFLGQQELKENNFVPALDLSELLELLPAWIRHKNSHIYEMYMGKRDGFFYISYTAANFLKDIVVPRIIGENDKIPANAMAKILIKLKEMNLFKPITIRR
jgi:hypothetical protein